MINDECIHAVKSMIIMLNCILINHIQLIILLNVFGHLIINYSKIKIGKIHVVSYRFLYFLLRIFALILSNDENYLMAVTFKGFKIFSFRSYLWKTCSLPGGVRNIMSGTKRLTYTAAFSHDNRFVFLL